MSNNSFFHVICKVPCLDSSDSFTHVVDFSLFEIGSLNVLLNQAVEFEICHTPN